MSTPESIYHTVRSWLSAERQASGFPQPKPSRVEPDCIPVSNFIAAQAQNDFVDSNTDDVYHRRIRTRSELEIWMLDHDGYTDPTHGLTIDIVIDVLYEIAIVELEDFATIINSANIPGLWRNFKVRVYSTPCVLSSFAGIAVTDESICVPWKALHYITPLCNHPMRIYFRLEEQA